ncbi:MAG: flagellar M-ring protein FliF [Bdellovibrionales bacterium]|nr:flagellar M-ring protein FliF [Bdellovibrionales bacterium]
MDFFNRITKQFSEFLAGQSTQKKIAMGVTAIAIVAGVIGLFMWAGNRSYMPLMTNLAPEDSANIVRVLREKNIPFKVDAGGKNISVSPENIDQLRMDLAIQGMPQNSVVGYEVFDKTNLGQTSFVQKVNQKRALEGELMRTVNSIHGVRRSRVHLAMPAKSTFVEDQKKSSASVIVDLEPGATLNDKQVQGIATLVAHAVEGLDTNDVMIVDSLGKTLSKNNGDSISQLTSSQNDFKQGVEREMERSIEEMLGRIVGDGHVVARVTADLDFNAVTEKQVTYDQDGAAIRSQQHNNQSMQGFRPTASGVAGAQSNTPLAQTAPSGQKTTDTKVDGDITNYAVPETVKTTTKAPGSIKRLSVAVVVDGKIIKTKDKDGVVQSKVELWAPEKLKEFEAIISSAVGFDKKRGDSLEVKNMEFSQTDFSDAEALMAERDKKAYVQSLLLYAGMGLVIVLFFFMVVRPFIKWITDNTSDGVETFLPQTLEELEKLQKGSAALPGLEDAVPGMPEQVDPEKIESEMVKEKVVTLVDANPQKAALILRDWLVAPASGAPEKKSEESKDKGKTA